MAKRDQELSLEPDTDGDDDPVDLPEEVAVAKPKIKRRVNTSSKKEISETVHEIPATTESEGRYQLRPRKRRR